MISKHSFPFYGQCLRDIEDVQPVKLPDRRPRVTANRTNWNQAAVPGYIINTSLAVVIQNRCRTRRNSAVVAMYTSAKECLVRSPPPGRLILLCSQTLLAKLTGVDP